MKRVVIDARESGTSTGRYVDKLIEYLHKLGPSLDIVVLTKPHRVGPLQEISPNFTVLSSPFKEFTISEQAGLLQQINKLKPDLVHFSITQQPVFYRGRAITTIHDLTTVRFRNPAKNRLIFTFKQQVYKGVIKRVAKKSDYIITPSQFVKHDVANYASVPEEKITVTYEAADMIPEKPEPVIYLASKEFVLYVGRPQPHKNLERLIEAFAILQKDSPQLNLVLAGKSDRAYELLQAYVLRRGIGNVIFTGFVSEGQLRWLYEQAKVYAFPSLSEGFGLPGLEAMHYDLPVVSSNATCLPEVYGDAALYFDPTNIDDIAEKVSAVLDSPELALKLAAAGKEQVGKYSWQRMAEQTLAAYDQVLDAD